MASAAERRAAQRQLASNLRSGKSSLPQSIRSGYASGVRRQSVAYVKQATVSGNRPDPRSEEGKLIARGASYMANDDRYEDDWDSGEYDWAEGYWYHDD